MNRGDIWQLDLGGRAGRRPAFVITRQAVIPYLLGGAMLAGAVLVSV